MSITLVVKVVKKPRGGLLGGEGLRRELLSGGV